MNHRIKIGAVFSNGTAGAPTYTIVSIDKRGGFTAERASGSTFKVSSKLMAACKVDAASGVVFLRQKNRPQGGISYTTAIEAGVVWALGLRWNVAQNGWTL